MNYLNMDSVIIPWDSADGAPYLEEDHWEICHQGGGSGGISLLNTSKFLSVE